MRALIVLTVVAIISSGMAAAASIPPNNKYAQYNTPEIVLPPGFTISKLTVKSLKNLFHKHPHLQPERGASLEECIENYKAFVSVPSVTSPSRRPRKIEDSQTDHAKQIKAARPNQKQASGTARSLCEGRFGVAHRQLSTATPKQKPVSVERPADQQNRPAGQENRSGEPKAKSTPTESNGRRVKSRGSLASMLGEVHALEANYHVAQRESLAAREEAKKAQLVLKEANQKVREADAATKKAQQALKQLKDKVAEVQRSLIEETGEEEGVATEDQHEPPPVEMVLDAAMAKLNVDPEHTFGIARQVMAALTYSMAHARPRFNMPRVAGLKFPLPV
ncbi:MAG: hypothetical protein M1823_004565 [Watsoniomyces obsoletus]|nr:MAG: hypothetical protein M1823_004565 [Watsoniomyces obsoletus]